MPAEKPTYEELEQRIKKLEEANELNKKIIRESPVGIGTCRADGQCISANESLGHMVGATREDILNQNFLNIESWKRSGMLDDALEAISTGAEKKRDVHLRTSFGKEVWLQCYFTRFMLGGKPHLLAMLNDITDRRQAEEGLHKALEDAQREHAKSEAIIAGIGNAVSIQDTNFKVLYQNQVHKDLVGDHTGDRDEVCDGCPIVKSFQDGKIHMAERSAVVDNSTSHVEITASPLKDLDGNVYAGIEVVRDITERKRAEEEKRQLEARLQQSQKLEAVGTLAGGIAHNFNNLLMTIQGNASLMLFDIDRFHPHYELLTEIKTQVKNGAELAAQLLGYARKGQYYVQLLNLNDLVTKASETIGATRMQISVHTQLSDDLFAIRADRSQVQQVLLNLCINAADAMPAGGDLFLITANITDKELTKKIYDPKPGKYVQLTVTDTGHGMDEETLKRAFEPFFTTKDVGHGTGLGLASVYGIIKAHGGYVDVKSKMGNGTTFTIYIPATDEQVGKTVESAGKVVEGSGTILFIDDEDRILTTGSRMLQRLGYTVIEARNGREALEIYRKNPAGIDLVLLDIVMPSTGGSEAYDQIKELNPNVKVLLTSGYSIDSDAKKILARRHDAFIQKPFDLQELSRKIRGVLDKE